jgi:hypothetical protein
MPSKRCPKCGFPKSTSEFTKNKSKKSGLASWCKKCMKLYHDTIPDKLKSYKKKYEKTHVVQNTKRVKEWRAVNPSKMSEYNRRKSLKYKIRALTAYSGDPPKCKCCGESNIKFLSIDHLNGCGTKQRKITGSGSNMHVWLYMHQYPPGFQVLCFNCNLGRNVNGGVCPHKDS